MYRERNGLRTIREGRIRLNGVIWAPGERHLTYDGRLDGQRFFFMEYPRESTGGLVALWGTEAAYHEASDAILDGPECVDGAYPWYFWYPVGLDHVDKLPESIDNLPG